MTAIAGFWSFAGGEAAASCERMLRSQAIYGPHGTAVWKGGDIAIGRALHRSLPEDAYDRGPQVGESNWSLVADIRLDNRDALAAALGLSDIRTLPDAAILLRALDRWGEEAVERLYGDFAFAAWDDDKKRLILARDFAGQRPLHYHQGRDFFAFASMAKGLHALPEVPYAPDMEVATRFVALLPERGTRTFFKDIAKVEAGHIVTVTAHGITARRYWNPDVEPLILKRDEDYLEAMRAQMDRAVEARIRQSDRGLATTLSAGLDSSVVTATAARLAGDDRDLYAFTSAPRPDYDLPPIRGTIPDERALAAATAALYPNVRHIVVGAGGHDPLAGLDRNFFVFERPILNLCNQAWLTAILEAAKDRGCGVLLIGQMGNMTFSYQGMDLLPRLLASGRLIRLAAEAVGLRRRGTRLGTIASQTIGPFLPAPIWKAISRLRGSSRDLTAFTAIHPGQLDRIEAAQAEEGFDLSFRPRRDGISSRLQAIGRVDLGNYNKGVLGGWGIDMRDPTADRELVEFCLRVPAEQYLRNGMPRALARRAFADRLPAELVGEMRKGHQAVDWHEGLGAARGTLRDELARIVKADQAVTTLDTAKMDALVENWPTRDWHKPEVFQAYRHSLLRGVSAGHFIRKAGQSNE